LLDTWGDLQNHLNSQGKDKAKEELKYIEENGDKLSAPQKKKLKVSLESLDKDRKTEFMQNIMVKMVEDVKLPKSSEEKKVRKDEKKAALEEKKKEERRSLVNKSEEKKQFQPIRVEKKDLKVSQGNIKQEREMSGSVEFIESRKEKLEQ